MKIISGGQTGVDRAALDAALKHGVECGGWVPAGRLDETGRIPDRYPVTELEKGGFDDRTRKNVEESDGTVIIHFGELSGGTEQTAHFCSGENKVCRLINAKEHSAEEAANLIGDFVREHNIEVLNVAGPRKSEWPEGYDYALRVLEIFLRRMVR